MTAAVEVLSYVLPADDDGPQVPGVHLRSALDHPTRPIPLPLCWIAEGEQRGATVDEWLVSIDHEALPDVAVTSDHAGVDCRDCLEWIHA